MEALIVIGMMAVGIAIEGYSSTKKVGNNSANNGIVIDYRTNPEVLNEILKHL